ncbi:META domain-containing protein [Gemmobacter denitrificans]|uniref:META domain-containing protein n=1 Tax=Gemmobacter denitrificans TaxID=3123040 RepID=A0ABU8BT09_9RHOB
MKAPLIAAAALTLLTACQPEAAPLTDADLAKEWRVVQLDGKEFAARATLDLTEPGKAFGQAPCNRWFAGREGSLPELRFGAAGATRMACPDLDAEAAFLEALSRVRQAALEGDRLVLTGEAGLRMELQPATP